jgi:hypothetical protein
MSHLFFDIINRLSDFKILLDKALANQSNFQRKILLLVYLLASKGILYLMFLFKEKLYQYDTGREQKHF